MVYGPHGQWDAVVEVTAVWSILLTVIPALRRNPAPGNGVWPRSAIVKGTKVWPDLAKCFAPLCAADG
jgi:hypothetical protein